MANVAALLLLIALYLGGQWLVTVLALPIPAALPGLVVLFFLLLALGKVPAALEKTSRFVLGHLAVFFIPATVAVALYWSQLQAHWPVLLGALVFSTLVSLALTAWLAKKILPVSSVKVAAEERS